MSEALPDRLDRELERVENEARKRWVGARGLRKPRRILQGVDIYAHPEAISHLLRALTPEMQMMRTDMLASATLPKRPRNAVIKYRNCWVFADPEQPEAALMIRIDGNVIADVPVQEPPQ